MSEYTWTGHEVAVYHVTGCGAIAFYFRHYPDDGQLMDPIFVVYADGTQPPLDTKALCGTCYEDLAITDLTIRRAVP